MTQAEIKQKANAIREKLKLFRKCMKREERDIIEEWTDLQELCGHPDKLGNEEGYCPDCGWTFG